MPCYLKTFKAIFVTTMLLVPALSNASQTGIPGYSQSNSGSNSCHNCHSFSMMAPSNQLTISGSNTVLAGATNSFTIKLVADESQNISYGGFDLSASNGTLAPGDSETRIINSELVHSNRKATIDTGDSYDVQWNFDWQAPATAGTTTFFACGLPVNGDGKATEEDNSRDGRVACTTFNIQVQQPPAAIAGNNQTVTEGDAVTLDGSFSIE
jgi:chitodextrinase